MRRTLRATRAAFAATLWAVAAPAQQVPQLPITSRTLGNGLEIIVIESHALPIVTVELEVRNGAFTQTPEYDGLSHLYEHMFFKANRAIPSQEQYLKRATELGLAWNGTTREENVAYYATVGVDSLAPALQ